MPIRLCSTAGCPEVATYRGRCPGCAHEQNRATHRNRSVYNSSKWQNTRKRVLHDHPLCAEPGCHMIATDVDHIHAIEDGGDPWSLSNLQGLCASHHAAKTNREVRAR